MFGPKTSYWMTLSGGGWWVSSKIFQKPVSGHVLQPFNDWQPPLHFDIDMTCACVTCGEFNIVNDEINGVTKCAIYKG